MAAEEGAKKKPPPVWAKGVMRKATYPTYKLPGREGDLTEPLTRQKQLLKALIFCPASASLAPADAVKRAAEAMEAIRKRAVEEDWDSEWQRDVSRAVKARFEADPVTGGWAVAAQAVELVRLLHEAVGVWKKIEKQKIKKGEPV